MSKIILIYLIIINIITLLIFGLDKLFAILKKSRVSEKTLLFLSIIGGCFLELFGMYLFNHKIRKAKFHIVNILFIIIYTLGLIYYGKYIATITSLGWLS